MKTVRYSIHEGTFDVPWPIDAIIKRLEGEVEEWKKSGQSVASNHSEIISRQDTQIKDQAGRIGILQTQLTEAERVLREIMHPEDVKALSEWAELNEDEIYGDYGFHCARAYFATKEKK